MALPTRSAAELNARLTSYSENYLNRVVLNQSFTVSPLTDHLMENKWDYDGGNEIVVPIRDGYTPAGDWFERGGTVNVAHVNAITQARYTPKFLEEPLFIDWTDEQIASGGGATLQFVEETINGAVDRIYEKLALSIVASSTTSPAMTTLLEIIDSTGAIGGLNPATSGQEFWASYEKASVGSFASNGPPEMRKALLAVTKYKGLGRPTAIFMSTTAYRAYQASNLSLANYFRAPGTKTLGSDLGTGVLTYEGIPVYYEPHLDTTIDTSTNTGIILFVNNKGVRLAVKPGSSMTMRPWVDMLPAGRVGRGTILTMTTQLVAQARSPLAKLTDVSA